ncbi:MAG: right-handed parallel beta-helix repeat-containing protein, partial [Verrucomicrobiota bacterium]|nr:right-handed parallel beta-helix repeat-containing protein [Verrucomicrobiota bacterium]
MKFNLLDCKFADVSDTAFSVKSVLSGEYNFNGNTLEKLDAKVAAKIGLGGDAGDIEVNYGGNSHSTKKGTASAFEEFQHDGKINWHIDGNLWHDSKIGVDAKFGVEGEKNFSNGTYEAHTKAGLEMRINAFSSGTIKVGVDGDAFLRSKKGFGCDVAGHVEFNLRALTLLDDQVGFDFFGRGNASGSLTDSAMNCKNSAQVGIRLNLAKGVKFEFFYQQGKFEHNARAFDVRDVPDPITIDGCTIVDNTGDAVVAEDSQVFVKGSTISSNDGSGIVLKKCEVNIESSSFDVNGDRGLLGSDSRIHVQTSEFISNGTSGLNLRDCDAEIITSLICFNRLDGIQINGDSDVSATTDIIDANGPFEIRNNSPNYVFAVSNGWGPINADEMNRKPYPSNISHIFDVFDDPSRGFVEYA